MFFKKSWCTLSSDATTFLLELRVPARSFAYNVSQKKQLAVTSGSHHITFPTAAITVQTSRATLRGSTHSHTHEGGLSFSATIQDSIRPSSVWPDQGAVQQEVRSVSIPATTTHQLTAQTRTAVSSSSQQSVSPHSELTTEENLRRSSNEHATFGSATRPITGLCAR